MYWSESGELVALACEDTFYVLRYSRENFVAALQAGEIEEDGVEAAFETITDINEGYFYPILPVAYQTNTRIAFGLPSGSVTASSTPPTLTASTTSLVTK